MDDYTIFREMATLEIFDSFFEILDSLLIENTPLMFSLTVSSDPPARYATTGQPAAIASTATTPKSSSLER